MPSGTQSERRTKRGRTLSSQLLEAKEGSRELDGKEDGNVGSVIRMVMRLGLVKSMVLPLHIELRG